MSGFVEDLRLALRAAARRPGFSAVVIATLGLAIGANAAVFSFVNAILLRPPAVERPERLVRVFATTGGFRFASVSYPNFRDYERSNDVFSAMCAEQTMPFVLGDSSSSQLIAGSLVSANYFSTLGVAPALGRAFGPDEDRAAGADRVVVIGDGLWRRHFAADRAVLGQALVLNGTSFKVVGVAPASFTGPYVGLVTEVWVPLSMQAVVSPGGDLLQVRGAGWLSATGRLRPGVTLAQAAASMSALAARMRRLYPKDNEGIGLSLMPASQARIPQRLRGAMVALSVLLEVIVGLVLAVACANAAGLFLARGAARRREIGIRLALGARTARLVRMLVSESLVLGLAGGAVGLLLALWAARLFSSWRLAMELPVSFAVDLDGRVLALTAGVTLATALLFGLLPALQIARPRLAMAMREGGGDADPRRARWRGALVTAQIAVTFLLLAGAGLFFRSLANARTVDLGFRADGLLVASLNLGHAGYGERDGRRFLERLEDRLRELPGVRSVSFATGLPFGLIEHSAPAAPEGFRPPAGEARPQVNTNLVAPGYFKTMATPVVAGREFTAADRPGSPAVAVVNEALARRFFPRGQALGQRFVAGDRTLLIVGIVRDSKEQLSLAAAPRPILYEDLFQSYDSPVALHLRAAGDPASLIPALRREVRAMDARVALYDLKPMTEQLQLPLLPERLAGTLLAAMGTLALVLALVGLYAATAFALARRTREIGIRMALGAGQRSVIALVLRGGMTQCLLGIGIGALAAVASTRFAASLLYGVSPTDPAILTATALLVAALALAANLVPALAATQIDPKQALGAE
jgi:predicted permease